MRKDHILRHTGVDDMINACAELDEELSWYIFGSVMMDKLSPADIDVLCVAAESSILQRVYGVCEDYLMRAPIHLRLLTSRQERELTFIERTKAWPYRATVLSTEWVRFLQSAQVLIFVMSV